MADASQDPQAATSAPPDDGPAADETLLDALRGILRELPGLVSDRVELLSLEVSRAGRALAQIALMMVAATILGVTAWVLLWVAIVRGLVALGLAWPWAYLLALLLNAGAIWVAFLRIKKQLPLLALPATRRHLTLTPSPVPRDHSEPPHERTPQADAR